MIYFKQLIFLFKIEKKENPTSNIMELAPSGPKALFLTSLEKYYFKLFVYSYLNNVWKRTFLNFLFVVLRIFEMLNTVLIKNKLTPEG